MVHIQQVTGHPKPSIQWQKDGKPLKENPRWKFIEEEDNYTLLIFEVRPDDVGRYDCVAINNVGKATCTAKLNVEGEEIIIDSPLFIYEFSLSPPLSKKEGHICFSTCLYEGWYVSMSVYPKLVQSISGERLTPLTSILVHWLTSTWRWALLLSRSIGKGQGHFQGCCWGGH